MDDVVSIPLTRGLVAIVDAADAESVLQHKWHGHRRNSAKLSFEPQRHLKYVDGVSVSETMAAFLMGQREGFIVDHVDGNPLNNRRQNLRWATRAQNAINWKRPNKTGVRGVFRNGDSRFAARIKTDAKRIYLGTFSTIEAAAAAYDAAALRHHGEFAVLNHKAGFNG